MSFILTKNRMPELSYGNRASLSSPIHSVAALNHFDSSGTNSVHPICLTFDDGPDPVYTQKILNVLADYDVKATFFVLGEAVEQFPHLVEKMLKAGHAIGNHTYSHRHPWIISSKRAEQEVTRTNNVIRDIAGVAPRWFRPPFGRLRTAMRRQADLEQMVTVLWNRSIIDWGLLGTKAGITRRLDQVSPGDIVLMHDGRPGHNHPELTVQCLPGFLRSLVGNALVTCTLDELFVKQNSG